MSNSKAARIGMQDTKKLTVSPQWIITNLEICKMDGYFWQGMQLVRWRQLVDSLATREFKMPII